MRLSTTTMELIEDRLSMLEPDAFDDDWPSWIPVKESLQRVCDAGTVESLAAEPVAQKELDYASTVDAYYVNPMERKPRRNSDGKRIDADLCRAGYYEQHDQNSVMSSRPKLMTVDGKVYRV